MICDNCKTRPAEVFLTQIVDGKMQKVNLCRECSKEKGVEDPTGFALADLLIGMGEKTEIPSPTPMKTAPAKSTPEKDIKCPTCGFTKTDFKKTGRLGCSECYYAFGDALAPLLKAMHKGTKHVGKVPVRLQQREAFSLKLNALRTDLEKAVKNENYESAAQLRDLIKQMEVESPSPTVSAPVKKEAKK